MRPARCCSACSATTGIRMNALSAPAVPPGKPCACYWPPSTPRTRPRACARRAPGAFPRRHEDRARDGRAVRSALPQHAVASTCDQEHVNGGAGRAGFVGGRGRRQAGALRGGRVRRRDCGPSARRRSWMVPARTRFRWRRQPRSRFKGLEKKEYVPGDTAAFRDPLTRVRGSLGEHRDGPRAGHGARAVAGQHHAHRISL